MSARVQRHLGGLQGAAQDVVEWSANMSGALAAQHQDIETYLTEEGQRDSPAGESGWWSYLLCQGVVITVSC